MTASERIDELLERASQAINVGDHETASRLARQVLSIDEENADAEDLLALPAGQGEVRRLTLLFADLVDSTDLSTRVEPEVYRAAVGRYKECVQAVVHHHAAHIASIKGDGLLVVFGHPVAHEDDIERAVQAGQEITRSVVDLSRRLHERFGFEIHVRVGVHRGLAYLDLEQDDIYGLAANLTARISGLAPPDSTVISASVEPLVRDRFTLVELPAQHVKGIDHPLEHFQVIGDRAARTASRPRPLVGRTEELCALEARWADAVAGKSVYGIAVCGEAGIGKSRLVSELVERAEAAGAEVLRLAGSSQHADVGLHPVRRLVEQRGGITSSATPEQVLVLLRDSLTAIEVDTSTHVSLLALVLGIKPRDGFDPVPASGARLVERTVEAAVTYVERTVAANGPALIVAEDLHWFDPDSREVLRRLLESRMDEALLVVTSRNRSMLPATDELEVIDLEPLGEEDASELVASINPSLDRAATNALLSRCGGIPLFLDQVAAALAHEGDIENRPAVPDTLYDSLLPRLQGPAARQVVEAAAIVGGAFDRDLLVEVAGLDGPQVEDVIAELLAERVFEIDDGRHVRFRHELVREVATELVPPTRRRELHADVAASMANSTGAKDWRVIADHYERADLFDEAAMALARMSATAQRRGALAEAREYLTRGLELVVRLPPGPGRDHREVFLRLRRGFIAYAMEGATSSSAAEDFQECLRVREDRLAPDILMTLTALYSYYLGRADLDHSLQVLTTLQTGLGLQDPHGWPTLTAGFGMVEWYRGEFEPSVEKLEEGVAGRAMVPPWLQSEWFMPNEPVASMHTHLAMARCILGDVAGTEEQFAEARTRCGEVGFPDGPYSLAYSRQMEVLMRIEMGQLAAAGVVASDLTTDAELHGLESWIDAGRAQQRVVAGLVASASDHGASLGPHIDAITKVVERWRTDEVLLLVPSYDAALARVLIAAERHPDARDRVDAALALAADTGMHYYDAELRRLRAQTHQDSADRDADLRHAIAIARRQGARIFELRAAVDLAEHHGAAAHPGLRAAIERFPTGSDWPDLRRARSLLA